MWSMSITCKNNWFLFIRNKRNMLHTSFRKTMLLIQLFQKQPMLHQLITMLFTTHENFYFERKWGVANISQQQNLHLKHCTWFCHRLLSLSKLLLMTFEKHFLACWISIVTRFITYRSPLMHLQHPTSHFHSKPLAKVYRISLVFGR